MVGRIDNDPAMAERVGQDELLGSKSARRSRAACVYCTATPDEFPKVIQ